MFCAEAPEAKASIAIARKHLVGTAALGCPAERRSAEPRDLTRVFETELSSFARLDSRGRLSPRNLFALLTSFFLYLLAFLLSFLLAAYFVFGLCLPPQPPPSPG
jgi:hypothetical protein